MPIPRRISQTALHALQPGQGVPEHSGTFAIPEDDDFSHVGELPSLMPPRNSPVLRLVESSPQRPPALPRLSHPTVQMPAVRASGYHAAVPFGDEDDEQTAPVAFDLEVQPAGHAKVAAPQPQQPQPVVEAPPPVSVRQAMPLVGGMSGTYLAAAAPGDPKPGIVAFAGYGIAPTELSKAPGYAFRVMVRRLTLRSDLKIARMRRLPQREIDLYEAALRCADEGVVTKGIAVVVSGIVGVVGVIAAVAATVL